MGICDDRVAIVTGAGRGIGREHALLLAAQALSEPMRLLTRDPRVAAYSDAIIKV